MKRLPGIVLLLILFLQTGGLLLVLQIHQQCIKFRMSRCLEHEQSVTEQFTLSRKDFKAGRINKREVFYKGNLYDIKKQVVIGDSVQLTAINDTEEKKLVDKINVLSTRTEPKSRELPLKIVKLYTITYLPPAGEDQMQLTNSVGGIYPVYNQDYNSIYKDILFPPPKSV